MKQIMKKTLCAALAATCLAGAAFAAPTAPETTADKGYTIAQENQMYSVRVYGAATAIGENQLTIKNSNEQDPYNEIVLNVTENTRIINAVTGEMQSFKDIRENEMLYAYAGPVMTRSMPPIANAELILCAIPADFGVPNYVEIESVAKNEDGSVTLETNRDVLLHVNKDTAISPYLTKNVVTMDDLVPGATLLAWYDIQTASLPAQAAPTKILLMPYSYEGYVSVSPTAVTVDGTALTLTAAEAPYIDGGKLMLPLRKFAEALGATAKYDDKTCAITVSNGAETLYTVTENKTAIGGAAQTELRHAAVIRDGVTFLAADDLIGLHGVKLAKTGV